MVLAGLSAVSPLATDMYVPGLPEMARSLQADVAGAQVSLTGFLIGIIVGQLALGPLSDSVGRRPVLLTGTSLFVMFSLVCSIAPSILILDVARVGQGLAGAAGIVVARATVTDLYDDARSARAFSVLASVSALGPVLAPLLGGGLLAVASWRVVFVVLAVAGALLVIGVLCWVPESLPREARASRSVRDTARSMGRLCARRTVLAPVLALTFGGASIFVYIAGTSFIFQDVYGLGPAVSSMVYGVNALGNMAGSLAYGRLARRWRPEALQRSAIAVALAGALVLTLSQIMAGAGLLLTWLCLFVSVTAFGVFFPAVTTLAQSRGRHAPGATSALLGGGQFAFGAAAAPLVGLFGTHSPLPMAVIMAACLALATAAALASSPSTREPLPEERHAS
ncbi:multidrug effflux MFS transporter [Streptomyces sp. NPDC058773]|uniref:multidrug effflux MFS transporter n=1 Tax=Streptomyces sp. NPDC058773 TaxID=3346632 RepID=UPI00368E0722